MTSLAIKNHKKSRHHCPDFPNIISFMYCDVKPFRTQARQFQSDKIHDATHHENALV